MIMTEEEVSVEKYEVGIACIVPQGASGIQRPTGRGCLHRPPGRGCPAHMGSHRIRILQGGGKPRPYNTRFTILGFWF
jgi:hypothetical protein